VRESDETVVVPFVAGDADLELLRTVSAFVPTTLAEHLQAIEEMGCELAETGVRVDLVPVWAPLFLVWCEEAGVDPGAAVALQRWCERDGLISVAYTHYECGPIAPLVELEEVRSWALRIVTAEPQRRSERAIAGLWSAAAAFLDVVQSRSTHGAELDVAVPTWSEPAHWHLDGSTCDEAAPALDHLHAALMEGLAVDGVAVLVEPGPAGHQVVRVWELGPGGIRPLSAEEAADRCEPKEGSVLVDAWGKPVGA
jgi:hypothetical protein